MPFHRTFYGFSFNEDNNLIERQRRRQHSVTVAVLDKPFIFNPSYAHAQTHLPDIPKQQSILAGENNLPDTHK